MVDAISIDMDRKEIFARSTTFNSLLKRIITFGETKNVKLRITRANRRARLAINESPLIAIETLGPHLFRHAKQIKEHDEVFFLNYDYDSHLDGETTDDQMLIHQMFEVMSKTYTKCSTKEKLWIFDIADDMLISYCGFLKQVQME
jgi:integrase